MKFFLAAMAPLLLAGCASVPLISSNQLEAEARWAAHRAQLAQIKQFTVQGRVASNGASGLSGGMRWTQNPDGSFNLHLAGPFGAGAVSISGNASQVEVKTSKGNATTNDPEGWIRARTGWSFPVAGLRWWVLGLPAPQTAAQLELDGAGLPKLLRQDGWQLDFREYQTVEGYTLPRKFDASNADTRIKLVLDRWTDLRAP